MPRIETRLIATAFLPILLASCGSSSGAMDSQQANAEIEKVVGDNQQSQATLSAAIAPFFEDKALAETRALVIMHKGRVVAERYSAGYTASTRQISWSMAKSMVGVLVGMMVADGLLVLDDPAPVPGWQSNGDPRGKITLRQLLNMESGLEHSEAADGGKAIYEADTTRMLFLEGSDDVARFAETRTLATPPGTEWKYSTATTHILVDIMTRALTDSSDPETRFIAMLDYVRGRLFLPLGMKSAFPEFDRNGTMLGGSMVHATPRDFAKFGEFLRNNGSVRSAKLLPTSWVQYMRTPSAQNPSYGAQLWLNKAATTGAAQVLFPGDGPSDIFACLGHLGQFIIVSPQHRLTIVRMGNTPDGQMEAVNAQLAKLIKLFPRG